MDGPPLAPGPFLEVFDYYDNIVYLPIRWVMPVQQAHQVSAGTGPHPVGNCAPLSWRPQLFASTLCSDHQADTWVPTQVEHQMNVPAGQHLWAYVPVVPFAALAQPYQQPAPQGTAQQQPQAPGQPHAQYLNPAPMPEHFPAWHQPPGQAIVQEQPQAPAQQQAQQPDLFWVIEQVIDNMQAAAPQHRAQEQPQAPEQQAAPQQPDPAWMLEQFPPMDPQVALDALNAAWRQNEEVMRVFGQGAPAEGAMAQVPAHAPVAHAPVAQQPAHAAYQPDVYDEAPATPDGTDRLCSLATMSDFQPSDSESEQQQSCHASAQPAPPAPAAAAATQSHTDEWDPICGVMWDNPHMDVPMFGERARKAQEGLRKRLSGEHLNVT